MQEPLYALKTDLDMITDDVHELKRSYNSVDYIAHTVKNLWDEQVCQSEQMRRLEEKMDKGFTSLWSEVYQLKADVAQLRTDVAQLKTDVGELKSDVAEIKSMLKKLCASR